MNPPLNAFDWMNNSLHELWPHFSQIDRPWWSVIRDWRWPAGKLGLNVASWVPMPLTTCVRQTPRKCSPFQSPPALTKFPWLSMWLLKMRGKFGSTSLPFIIADRRALRSGKGPLHRQVSDAKGENPFLVQAITCTPCNYIPSILCRSWMLSDPFSDHLLCQLHMTIIPAVWPAISLVPHAFGT